MKTILVTILLFGMMSAVDAQDSLKIETPEELGRQVFTAFQTNDFVLFESLLITFEKHDRMLAIMEATDSAKSVYKREDSLQIVAVHCNARQNFDRLVNKVKKRKIDWSTVELVEIKSNLKNKQGIERAEILIIVKSGDLFFFIGLGPCMKADNWFIAQEIEIKI
ncbi:MAG: hypothetical protein ACYC1Q_10105 [Bacteroidia bacterium]